jgi:antitoxin (DNA-binding transcriptional repressor) of toxin-antitoxin stability system
MRKYVAASEAQEQFETLVSEVEATGDEVGITRGDRLIARLLRTDVLLDSDESTPEGSAHGQEAPANLPTE